MKVQVRFFSQLRDLAGADELQIELAAKATVAELLRVLYQRFPSLSARDKSILVGAGVEFVERDHEIQPGEEISIMPPVQGG